MSNGGGIVTFDLKGGIENGRKFLNALQMLSMTNNLGDSRSIASHPASMGVRVSSRASQKKRMSCLRVRKCKAHAREARRPKNDRRCEGPVTKGVRVRCAA